MSVKLPSYLQRNRYGVFHFRRVIPDDLRSAIGRREFQRSLRTRETRDAITRARILALQTDKLFEELREAMVGDDDDLTASFSVTIDLSDGTRIKKEVSPADITAMKDAGLSPEQIESTITATPFSPNQNPISTRERPHIRAVVLSELIKRFNADRVARNSGRRKDGRWQIPNTDLAKQRRLTEILDDISIDLVDREGFYPVWLGQ